MHDDIPVSAPRLDPVGVDEGALQRAVDEFDTSTVQGIEEPGYEVTIVGIDIMPGIVIRQGDRFEAPATIYLDLRSGHQKMSKARRGIVEFLTEDIGIVIKRVAVA